MTAMAAPDQAAARDRAGTKARARRTDIDGLRIAVCGCVIVAHAILIFAAEPLYHLKSAVPSPSATVVYEFMRITTMPVFFVIAGWAATQSMRSRAVKQFAKDRVTRLLVPLVIGVIVFCPIIKYVEMRHGRHLMFYELRLIAPLQQNYFEFYLGYLSRSVWVTWSHLWFLAYLFVISFLLLPLLAVLARSASRASVPSAPLVYLPALALAGILVAFDGYWPFMLTLVTDKANLSYFALCFALGAMLAVWPGFEARLRSEAPRLLVLMLAAFVGVIWVGESTLGRLLVGVTAWAAIGAALGYTARLKPTATPVFNYLSEATMAVYIVHHAPLLVIAAYVLPMDLPVWPKIALISFSATAVTLAFYHWLIRPWPPIRSLLGMVNARPRPFP